MTPLPNLCELVAHAPAMARLLRQYAFYGAEWSCPSCAGDLFPQVNDINDKVSINQHDPDCELVAVLRAAGVLDATTSSSEQRIFHRRGIWRPIPKGKT